MTSIHEARERGDFQAAVAAELDFQANSCAAIGSSLYDDLLSRAADDVRAAGVTWELLRGHATEPPLTALPLRMMAAVHRLVLTGRAPGLARHFPTAGGDTGLAGAWDDFRAVIADNLEEVRQGLDRPCQTNEPARAAALLGGFLHVAGRWGLPLRLLEVGTSAGLLLRWDHYRYVTGSRRWGPQDSPVVFDRIFESAPPFDVEVMVAERSGADPNPQDPTSEETRLNLMASAWPDQVERFHALEGALEIARRVPVNVTRGDGPTWLEARLAEPQAGVATVVFHSIVLQYLNEAGRRHLQEVITSAAARATGDAPLAWLSFEPGDASRAHVHLTTWPADGQKHLVATAGYHGRPVTWLGLPQEPLSP